MKHLLPVVSHSDRDPRRINGGGYNAHMSRNDPIVGETHQVIYF